MTERPLFWLGSSLDDVRRFPNIAKQRVGFELSEVQQGRMPSDWKSMTSVGTGVYEIRIHTDVEHRVLYVAKFTEGIYVLHAFEKKTQRTRQHDLDTAQKRLAELMQERRKAQKGNLGRKPK